MKLRKISIIVIGLALGFAACKNENDNSLVGKWREVKLTTYDKSYSGVISNKDSSLSAALDTTDYALFNSGGTCVLSNHYIYYGLNGSVNKDAYVVKENYTYTPVGSKYVLALQAALISPSGFVTTDTLSRIGNTILIRSITDNHQDYAVSDAYYTR